MNQEGPIYDLCEVVSNQQLSESLWWIILAAPHIAQQARPGQFVHIGGGDNDPLLRRPYSLAQIDRLEGVIGILYHVVGRGSAFLAGMAAGATADVLGPLGSSFNLPDDCRHLLLVGGGIGMGPLIASAHKSGERDVVVLNGARSQSGLTPIEYLPPAVEIFYASDEGSRGHHGSVIDLIGTWYDWSDAVLACGPNPMLVACSRAIDRIDQTPRRRRRPTLYALEARMACGLGVCYSCVVTTRKGLARVCHDGPVFDAYNLTWEWDSGI